MESTTTLDPNSNEATPDAPAPKVITKPDYSEEPRSISQFTTRADYPACLHGVHIDIRGFAGVVVEIVNQSIRVLSPEGILQSFNFNRLKTLYAPAERPAPMPEPRSSEPLPPDAASEPASADETPAAEEPERIYIAEPDFSEPCRVINDYARREDFPQCAYGRHVDIQEFTGVVVEIVKSSLKIQSPDGIIRSYNAGVLKKLYGQA